MKYLGLFLLVTLVAGQVPAPRINENDSPLEPYGVQDKLKKFINDYITVGGDMRETERHVLDELISREDKIRLSYSEKLQHFLENVKVTIREGNESLSIPPLDPFQKDLFEAELDEEYVRGSVKLTNFEALGLAGYKVNKAEIIIFPTKLIVGLSWDSLYSSGSYKLDAVALNKIEAYGEGNYTVMATDLSFETTIFIRLSPLSIKRMETQVSLGGLALSATGLYNDEYTSMVLSNVISDVVPILIQEHHDEVTTEINKKVMEFGNKQLEGMTLSELLAIIS